MVRVMVSSVPRLPPSIFPVTSTSTIVPGVTNPATPTTSFTATESARIPCGITAGNPAPDSLGASLLSRISSLAATSAINARLAQSSIRVNIPATGSPAGQGIRRRLLASTGVPRASGLAATTMCPVAAGLTLAFWNCRYTTVLSRKATTTATANPSIMRFWFMKSVSSPQTPNRPNLPGFHSQSPVGRAKASHGGDRDRYANGQFEQPGIVQRNFGVSAQSKRKKSLHQHNEIAERFLDSPGSHHFHHRHQSRYQNASE